VSFFDVTPGKIVVLKCNYYDLYISFAEFHFMITQLRDMGPARQSAEMAVKDHQKPIPLVVSKTMVSTLAVSKAESNSGFSRQILHSGTPHGGLCLRLTKRGANATCIRKKSIAVYEHRAADRTRDRSIVPFRL
jgi:hypothetical protein